MAEEPDNLVLQILREMREELGAVRIKLGDHDKRFDKLEKMISDWQETTATGVGLAAHANHRTQAIEQELAALKERVTSIERRL